MQKWKQLLDEIQLNPQERNIAEKFQKQPQSRFFLPLCEVLKRKGYKQEAIEILCWGLKENPNYKAARVLLAKEYYENGMIEDSFKLLYQCQNSLKDNVMAQKLLFNNAIIANLENFAKSVHMHMEFFHMLDNKTMHLGKVLNYRGPGDCRELLLEDFKKKQINVIVPKKNFLLTEEKDPLGERSLSKLAGAGKTTGEESYADPMFVDESIFSNPNIKNFFVVPLKEIFQVREPSESVQQTNSKLDLQTIAEIYQKQGYYEKSLEAFTQLLKKSPNNDYFRKSIQDLTKAKNKQAVQDRNLTPTNKQKASTSAASYYTKLLEQLKHESNNV